MTTTYYVVLNGDCVEGPFASRAEANRRAAQLTTNEVGLHYRVSAVTIDS